MKTKPVAAKSAANTARNAAKVIRRRAAINKQRPVMLGFIPGAPLVPVLDLNGYGGPDRVRAVSCVRHHVSGTRAARAVEFHNRIAAAFEAAGLR